MEGREDWITGLRDQAQKVIAANAAALGLGPSAHPASQWWNLPAKIDAANAIMSDELHRFPKRHNDAGDAMRHAEASKRLAEAAGPTFAAAAGLGHELVNFMPPVIPDGHLQPISEGLMDMWNNAQGIAAARNKTAIDPAALQTRPISLHAAYARANQQYQDTSPDAGAYRASYDGADPYGGAPTPYDPEPRFPPYR